jgi:hypothetical protein
MARAPVPPDARVFIEYRQPRPQEVAYEAFGPFEILWVITNGSTRHNFLWVCLRKTGIYVAFGGPTNIHTSYHSDGNFHWKVGDETIDHGKKPPLPDLPEPVMIQGGTSVITDDALDRFELTSFDDRPVDRVVYLDNRMLPPAVSYQVWAVPPFRHATVPLMTDHPAHIHIVTHTIPWLQLVIYEQGERQVAT